MSTKKLAISFHDNHTLLVKYLTIRERFNNKSEEEVLSDAIHLPGFKYKPVRIGFAFKFESSKNPNGDLIAFVENCDFLHIRLPYGTDGQCSCKYSNRMHKRNLF